MQTFITDHDMATNAYNLDSKRLGKQRVETIQILHTLCDLSKGWKNHPATLMWKGYEKYLLLRYLSPILDEWERRGYNNEKCHLNFMNLVGLIINYEDQFNIIKPPWITNEFILSHRSNLVRKNSNYYRKFWPDIPDNLPYIWPVRKGD